jgi:hypothetical protein
MKSPKFKFTLASIEKCVSPEIVADLWKKKIRAQLRRQIVWDIIEYKDIDNRIIEFSNEISMTVCAASYKADRPHPYLIEKSRGLCRQMMLVGPKDLVLLQCLSSALQSQILKKSPSKAAFFQPGDMKWSEGKMTVSDGDYGSIASWKKFQKQVLKFRKENKYIVVTDVANFYDFINFRHLRNIISSLCEVDEAILDLLLHLLSDLTWTPDYMPRQDIGMPQIESEAPRVLANAMLFELDRVAEKYAYKNYARFMDDIDCGVMTIVEAKCFVRDIDLTLQSRQLRLNSAKTKILSQQDAFKHFCVSENSRLDRYTKFVESALKFKLLKPKIGARILHFYENWLSRDITGGPGPDSAFRKGNGSKIHKRVLTLLKRCDVEVPSNDLLWLIRNDPAMRQTAFRHLSSYSKANENLYSLITILKRNLFVDDAAYVDFANFCVYAKFKRTKKLVLALKEAVHILNKHGPFGAYASTVILARIGGAQEINEQAILIFKEWPNHVWLCRTIAGTYPLILNTLGPISMSFLQLIRSSKYQSVLDVLDHHSQLMNSGSYVLKNFAYLSHPNATFPQGIYFPKALQILSVRGNASASSEYKKIIANQPTLLTDPFFKAWNF